MESKTIQMIMSNVPIVDPPQPKPKEEEEEKTKPSLPKNDDKV